MLFNKQWHFQWFRGLSSAESLYTQALSDQPKFLKTLNGNYSPLSLTTSPFSLLLLQLLTVAKKKNVKLSETCVPDLTELTQEANVVSTFYYEGCKMLRLSAGVTHAFSLTDVTVPMKYVRMPYNAFYFAPAAGSFTLPMLHPEPGEENGIPIEGVYVLTGRTGEERDKRLLAAMKSQGLIPDAILSSAEAMYREPLNIMSLYTVSRRVRSTNDFSASNFLHHQLCWKDGEEQTAEEIANLVDCEKTVKNAKPEDKDGLVLGAKMIRLVLNAALYLSSPEKLSKLRPEGSLYERRDHENDPRKREKIEAKIRLNSVPDEYIVGQHVVFDGKHANAPVMDHEASGREMCVHWRRGHWRGVWVGRLYEPETRHMEPRWIKPVLVNAEKGPAPEHVTYHVKEA
jgi:hypothetical protein